MDREKRYQIVTYCYDCGSDDKLEYKTIKEAIKEAKKYLSDGWDKVFIYDRIKRSVRHAFNGVPDGIFSDDVDISHAILHWNMA